MTRRRYTKITSFGEVLKRYRMSAGLSQATLARRTGMSSSLVALMEMNRRKPRRDKVEALVGALRLGPKEQRRVFLSAGYAAGQGQHRVSFLEKSKVTKALEELMNDPKLNPKQKLDAESLLEAFIYWVQDRMVKGKL